MSFSYNTNLLWPQNLHCKRTLSMVGRPKLSTLFWNSVSMCDVRWVSNSNEAGLCGLPFENRVTVILSFLAPVAPAHSLFVVSVPMTKSLAFTLKAIFAKLNWPLKPKLRWQKKGLDLIRHGLQSCPLFRIGSAQLIKAYSVQAWWLSDLFLHDTSDMFQQLKVSA